jgi:sucrose phosphorylase
MSEQIDLDLRTQAARDLITRTLSGLASHGVSTVRLDAVGYVVKKPGTSSFMVEPEIYDFLDWVTEVAGSFGMAVLPEIHDRYSTHQALVARGHWTYDFVLPALLLYALETHDTDRLVAHLMQSPAKQFTVLDCHDGIPIQPDLSGILTTEELAQLAELVLQRGGNVNRILSASHAQDGLDVHQLNCTYYSAVGADDDRYLTARAIQLFARGVPQIYYVGLLAGANDYVAAADAGEGRAINRHNFGADELESAIRRPIVQRVLDLVRLRNCHPAFRGALVVATDDKGAIVMTWRNDDTWCELRADVSTGETTISSKQSGAEARIAPITGALGLPRS